MVGRSRDLESNDAASSSPSVTQSNALIEASYTMSLDEKRLLVSAIGQLNPSSKAWQEGRAKATIHAGDWGATYGLKQKSAYGQLREASKHLYERSVRIRGDHRNGKHIRWISSEEYSEAEGRVTISFSGDILFYLTGMIDEFTSYKLLNVGGLKSIHSIRLYEQACRFKDTGWSYISLLDIREMFCLGDAYPEWQDLKRRVIDQACKEITTKSNLHVRYEVVKRGRSVHAIRLLIEEKQQMDMFNS